MPKVDYTRTIEALESEAAYGTQKALAESLGVNPRTVRRYKTGEIDVSGEIRERIYRRARYYGTRKYEEERGPPPGANIRGTAVYQVDEGDTDTPLKVTAQGFRVESYAAKPTPWEWDDLFSSHQDRAIELMQKALQKIANTNLAEADNVPNRDITSIGADHPNVSVEASRTGLPTGRGGINVTIIEKGRVHQYDGSDLESW